jgi:outer membrane protein assembly factor BamB
MVFVSQLNGDQVALDQETGKVKWSTPVVKPGQGYSITSAPLYFDAVRELSPGLVEIKLGELAEAAELKACAEVPVSES